ncbi:DUF6929 family protein [Flavobacterium glaciei]|uniref:Delta-60 repeat protein n=1 Tax=Flavobacterium glaciei TaxID=386300 RepID=A0A562PR49_9FLAO|nr:hypothetical protein [Flavobacterium glaciei]RDI53704.1 hypothetical protein DFR66_10851 [Flavobacterium glaciei]TWI46931.1 hypothetical protein IQ02_01762 [Flavobacterium glaciei]
MEKFKLELLFQIIGIGSASGLIYKDNSLLIIGDNSGFLYEYNTDTKNLKRHPLLENPIENTLKKDKADFEAITQFGDSIYIFGSGSTEKRNKMIQVNATDKKIIATNDLSDLYAVMQNFGDIKPEDFNLEGAIYNGESWFLLNRGNGSSHKNVIFTIEGKNLTNDFTILSNDYKLPKIKGVRSSFTDGIIVGDSIYFLATAEDTESTYDDGEVLESFIGSINLKTMKIDFTQKISSSHKFEGLTLHTNSKEKIEFLLCEDKDTEVLETDIYKLTLDKK